MISRTEDSQLFLSEVPRDEVTGGESLLARVVFGIKFDALLSAGTGIPFFLEC